MDFNILRFREIMASPLAPLLRAHICAWALTKLNEEMKDCGDERTWARIRMMRDEVTKELLSISKKMGLEVVDGPGPNGWLIVEA